MSQLVNAAISADKISDAFLSHAKNSFLKDYQVEDFINACCQPLRKSIRINTLKISVTECLKEFEQYDLVCTPIPWCKEGFWIAAKNLDDENGTTKCSMTENSSVLGNLPEHLQGLFYIQEASSMLPPSALIDSPENLNDVMILDMAAAPGSKTTQLAALVDNSGLILANEMSASRVKVLHANLVRCGVYNTCMSQFDGRKLGERLSGLFDFVLLDAPCGGEGTIRKDASALKDWQLSKVEEIAKLQKQLIKTAYQCLKPGGRLVYSTCTLSPEENQQVVLHLVAETDAQIEPLNDLFDGAEQSVTQEGFLHVLPQIYDSEGFFVAAVSKPKASEIDYYIATEKTPFLPVDKRTLKQVNQYYANHFGLELSNLKLCIKQRDKEIWLFPNRFEDICGVVRLNRSGIKLAEIYPNKIRSTHEFICCLGDKISEQRVTLDPQQAEDFYKGRNLEIESDTLRDGEVILTLNGHSIGLGNLRKNKIKNQLPRDLVRDQIRFAK